MQNPGEIEDVKKKIYAQREEFCLEERLEATARSSVEEKGEQKDK